MSEPQDSTEIEVEPAQETQQTPAVADDVLPDTLYLMPVPHRPFFPGQVQPIGINPAEWQSTLEALQREGHGLIGLSYVEMTDSGNAEPRQFPEIGCAVRLHRSPMAADQRRAETVSGQFQPPPAQPAGRFLCRADHCEGGGTARNPGYATAALTYGKSTDPAAQGARGGGVAGPDYQSGQ